MKSTSAPAEGNTQDTDKRDQPGDQAPTGHTVEGPEPDSEQMQDIVHEADKKAKKNVEDDTQTS